MADEAPEMTEALMDNDAAPVSIDDFISGQIDALESEGGADEAPAAAEEPKQEATEGEPATDEPEPDTEAAKAEEGDKETEGDEPAETQTITAPQSMSAKDREAFYKLPPEQQNWLSDRAKQQEAAFTQKTMELADQRKVFDKLEQVIAPRRQQLAMNGMDESTAIGQLFALSDFANQDPVGFVRHLFNERGIPLDALNQPGQQTQPTDPQLLAVKQQLQALQNGITQQQTQTQQQQLQSISSAIDEFAADPAHPFYSDLETEMIPLVATLREQNPGQSHKDYLAKAYKMAMAANEEVSAKAEADRKAQEAAQRIAKAKKDAAAAKKAKGTTLKTTGSLPSGAKSAKSVDDFIGALVDERMTA